MALPKQLKKRVLLSLIDRPEEPDRLEIDSEYIKELAESIREIGLMNAIALKPKGDRYEVIWGDRRYLAHIHLGLPDIEATIHTVDDEQMHIMRATENLQRENLTPIEEAYIYRRMHDKLSMNWEQIGKRCGKSPGSVKRRYDLLKLPECLITAVQKKQIAFTVAEELGFLKNLTKVQYLLQFAIDHGATTAVVRQWVRDEHAVERNPSTVNGGGGWASPPGKSLPVYVACDLCTSPMEIGTESVYRVCGSCTAELKRIQDAP